MQNKNITQCSNSFMSDAKWRELFRVVNCASWGLGACVWKLTDAAEPAPGWLPDARRLQRHAVGDCGALDEPFEFSAIEWLFIPAKQAHRPYRNAPIRFMVQDSAEIRRRIEALGRYEYEINGDGIKIFGYRRTGQPAHPGPLSQALGNSTEHPRPGK